jgi:hypothetical protein
VRVARVLVVDVGGDVERRIGAEHFTDISGHRLREALGLARQRRTAA